MDNRDSGSKAGSGWASFVAPKVGKQDLKRSAAQLRKQISDDKRVFSTGILGAAYSLSKKKAA